VTKYSTILEVFQQPWPGVFSTVILNEEEGPGDEVEKMKKKKNTEQTREAPGALDPAVVGPLLGCKIYYGHSRYEP